MCADKGKVLFSKVVKENKRLAIQLPVAILCLLSRAISPLNWVEKEPSPEDTQLYVGIWVVVLIGLTSFVPKSGIAGLVLLAIGFYRLQDLLFSTLDDALGITGRFRLAGGMTKVLITLVNIVQIVLIFTIAFSVLTTKEDWAHPPLPFGTQSCFILSWSSLTPFTVNTNASDSLTWTLTMVESAIAVVILLVALSRFLSLPSSSDNQGNTALSKPATVSIPGKISPPANSKAKARATTQPHHGRPVSWVAVGTMMAGFLLGGIGLISGPTWWLFWVGAGIVAAGGLLALATNIFDDWY
jgi:hypothetical protein